MRVLIFSELLYPHGGGAELATWLYAKMLAENGFELSIITTKFPGERSFEVINKRIRIYRFRFPLQFLLGTRYYTLINNGVIASNFITKLIKWSDVVYIPGEWYAVIPFAKVHKKPVIVHLHNYSIVCPTSLLYDFAKKNIGPCSLKSFMFHEYIEKKRSPLYVINSCFMNELLGKHYSKLGRLADVLVCVSRRQAELIKTYAPELADRIKICYNPLPNIPLCEKRFAKPTFLYLGGESYVKGFHIFLSASYAALKRGVEAHFILTQDFSHSVKAFFEKINNAFGNVYCLVGRIKHEEVLNLHSKTYSLIFPSIWEEPLPYAIIESMLLGTIPISSKVGGVAEIVKGTFAEEMLFPPGDINALVDRMEIILSMKEENLHDIGHKLRNSLLKKFDEKETMKLFIKLISEITT